jgi:hypothetical protein
MRIPSTRVVAGVQLASGVYCIAAGLFMLPTAGWRAALLVVGGMWNALAAFWLWRGAARGIALSMWLQAVQVLQVVVPGVALVMVLGPSLVLGFPSGEAFSFRAAVEPEFLFAFGHHTNPIRFELNLLALVFIVVLRRAHVVTSAPSATAASNAPAV